MGKQNRTESLKINPYTYGKLIFDKRGKNIQWRNDNLFSKLCQESWTAISKSTKLEHILTPYTKINSKQLKDLSIRHYSKNSQKRTQVKHSLTQIILFSQVSFPRQNKCKQKKKKKKMSLHQNYKLFTAKETINK